MKDISNLPQAAMIHNSVTRRKFIDSCPVIPFVIPTQSEICGGALLCKGKNKIFGSNDAESWKKDYSSFLTQKAVASDTIAFELLKNGVKVADLNDNSYGTYYASFTAQPLYSGFLVDWTLVLNAFGSGNYIVRINQLFAGQQTNIDSATFFLQEFNAESAHRTVKIETWDSGNILSNGLNFTDLLEDGWRQSYRIEGFFGEKRHEPEIDNYLDNQYNANQNRPSIQATYSLYGDYMLQSLVNELSEVAFLANRIEITDYRLDIEPLHRNTRVVLAGYNEAESVAGKTKFRYTFNDYQQNIIKRNF